MTQNSTKTKATTSTRRRAVLLTGASLTWLSAMATREGRADAAVSDTSAQERAAIKLVSDFIAAFRAQDINAIASFMTDDCMFYGGPMTGPPVQGKPAFIAETSKFFNSPLGRSLTFPKGPSRAYAFGGSAGTAVLTKRVDYRTTNGNRAPLALAAFYWVINDKIQTWNDFGLSGV